MIDVPLFVERASNGWTREGQAWWLAPSLAWLLPTGPETPGESSDPSIPIIVPVHLTAVWAY